jgi:hypothetical protein
MLPHWLAWPLMLLGIWYLPLPLGGYYWSAYILGLVFAVGLGIWAWRSFRVVRLEASEDATVLRIERRRERRGGRARRAARVAVFTLVALLAITAVGNQLVAKPSGRAARKASIPPRLHDDRPLPSIEGPSGKSRVEPTLTHVAAVISGYGTEVRCWSVADWRKREAEWGSWRGRPLGAWGGYTDPWSPPIPNAYRINLSPSICASLARLAYEEVPVQEDPWPEALAWSVAALAHESQHVRGIGNEAQAECYGMQAIQKTTEALGRSAADGRYFAALYWREYYLKQRSEEYRSDECRDGRRLDMRPETHVWP